MWTNLSFWRFAPYCTRVQIKIVLHCRRNASPTQGEDRPAPRGRGRSGRTCGQSQKRPSPALGAPDLLQGGRRAEDRHGQVGPTGGQGSGGALVRILLLHPSNRSRPCRETPPHCPEPGAAFRRTVAIDASRGKPAGHFAGLGHGPRAFHAGKRLVSSTGSTARLGREGHA